ncbi:glutaminase A [Maricaulis sp.]|uniref:glutaminase A n=1 Tax=Maricaulis sp. TaxID=1486257 RepID=UPI0025B8FD57|nr:glutaminase A [Maricaulis sp.]
MTAPGSDPFARFVARPARFEQAAGTPDSRHALARDVSERAAALGLADMASLRDWLQGTGLAPDRLPRLAAMGALGAGPIDENRLASSLETDALTLLRHALDGNLAIPHFGHFANRLSNIFAYARDAVGGALADYIPELAKQDPDAFGLAACTIDGQQMALGDADTGFCQQSVIKPLIYALAMGLNGESQVHRHVGREPSGRRFNELALDPDNRPHNPMINSGAIMCSAMIRPNLPVDARARLLERFVRSAAGGGEVTMDQAVYESERATARRNLSLVKLMDEHDAFPEGSDPDDALELYFRACAVRLDCRQLATVAATLANGGVCPTTGHRVIDSRIVRNTLSLMLTCGMYDYSGEYAFTVGLPAKSGVSGGLMIVVPGVGGFGLWSPPLDRQGNPVRGIEVSRRLVEAFPFHIFAGVTEA